VIKGFDKLKTLVPIKDVIVVNKFFNASMGKNDVFNCKKGLLYLDFVHNLYDCLSTRKYTHLFITIEA